MNYNHKPILLLGLGGHARVLINILRLCGREIIGALSTDALGVEVMSVKSLGHDQDLVKYSPSEVELVNAIGQSSTCNVRKKLYIDAKKNGFNFVNVIHPSATIASDVSFGEGVQIMAGAIIEPAVSIGNNSIINTSTSINHDTMIGAHSHIAPGVVICGGVNLGDNVLVGAGATLLPQLIIPDNAFIKAGQLVKYSLNKTSSFGSKYD